MTFEIYFSDGCVHTQEAKEPLHAIILAQADSIRLGFSVEIDSVINLENGKVYKIKQEVTEIE